MNALVHRLEPAFLLLDRIAGGRHATVRVPDDKVTDPRTRTVFRRIAWLLAVELVLGLGAVVVALVLARDGASVGFAVWMRTVVVLGITATLVYFTWRASRGWYWAYQRLTLFSRIFPVVTLVLAAIPHLYPLWMVSEQILFSLVLIGVSDYLGSAHMREVFPRPPKPRDQG